MKLPTPSPAYLRNMPVKRKLTLMVLTTSLIILLLACVSLFCVQLYIFKRTFVQDLTSLAEMVAANAVGPLSFRDHNATKDVLEPLKARPHVVAVSIRLPDDTKFVFLGEEKHDTALGPELGQAFQFARGHCFVSQPIGLNGDNLGTLYVRADFNATYRGLLLLYGGILCLVMLGATGVALLVCTRMQRVIADPIQQLAQVTQRVATARDYSIRAKKAGDDEIGQLTDAFNQMLSEIESGDQALRRLNRIIEESEKAERKRAQTNQARLIAILEATPDFVGSADADGHMLYLNQAGRNMVGFGPDDDISSVMFDDLYPEWAVQTIRQLGLPSAIRDGVWGGETALLGADGHEILLSQVLIAHRNMDGSLAYYSTVGRDITAQKRAREEMDELNRQLVATSRQAGMAEVATGVLHNVGNVLNSVSVSATLVSDRLKKSKAVNLHRATELMAQQNGRLAEFLTSDPKGKVLPEYFGTVSAQIIAEQSEMLKELTLLGQNIEHIKEIVAMQQSYAKVSGAYERLDAVELVEDAFRLNAAAFERHHIQVVREYEQNLPRVNVDRHKVLQILINLIRNAKYAMDACRNDDKQLVLQVQRLGESSVAVRVRDNGHGISAENLTRIFQHGFTTKKEGHGFGLHSGANAAKEMGGRLVVHSDGPDQGAEFTLELPVAAARPVSTT